MRGRHVAAAFIVGGVALVQSGCVMARVYRDHPLDEQKIAAIRRGEGMPRL